MPFGAWGLSVEGADIGQVLGNGVNSDKGEGEWATLISRDELLHWA